MIYLYAFIFVGIISLLGQIILDNTNFTPGHITSLFTLLGVILSFLGIYDYFINTFGGGATIVISNFGHSLFTSGYLGYLENGILGIFQYFLCKPSIVIVGTIIFSFITSIFNKARD